MACSSDSTGPAGPLSTSRSLVEVTSGVVASGDTTVVRLILLDANGRRVGVGGNTVIFGLMGGTSNGLMGPVRDAGNGTYTGTFTGVVAGTPATVTASVDGSPVTSPLPTIEVAPGAASPAMSLIDVSPRTVTRGGQATISLDARDAAGNSLGTGGLSVAFTASGGTATGTMGPVNDQGNGQYTAVFTGTGLGSPLTIGGTLDGMPITSALPTLSVAYGIASDSSVISASSDTVSVNQGITLTLEVRDSGGVARTSGGDTVVFSFQSTGGGSGTIDSTTDQGDGSYTATFKATQAGAVTIGATLNGRAVGGVQPVVSILGASVNPQKSSVSVSRDTVAAGDTATLTLTVRDLDSNQTATTGLIITFTAGNSATGGGTIGPVSDHNDGTYTAVFTGTRAGPPAEIGAVINDTGQVQMLDSTGASHLPTITVVPGPVAPDSSSFSVTPSRLAVGDSALVQLTARDSFRNVLDQGGLAVSFQRSGGSGVSVGHLGPVADQGDGTYLAQYFADTAGVADTLNATIGGVPVATAMPLVYVTCTPGPVDPQQSILTVNDTTPSKSPSSQVALPSGVTTTITLQVRDAHGCSVTASHTVAFSATGGTSTGQLGATVDQGDGSYAATFTGVLAGTPLDVGATVDGNAVTSASPTITVIPGDISAQTSFVTLTPVALDSGAHSVATLHARDAAGNALISGGRSVIFSVTGSPVHGTVGPASDPGNGTYLAVYTATAVDPAVADSVTAAIEGTPLQTTPPTVVVVAGTISPDQSLVSLGGTSVAAGDSVLLTLTGKDAAGRALVTGDRTTPIAFTQAGAGTGVIGTLQNPDDGSYHAWFYGRSAGGPTTIGALIGGTAVTTTLPTLTVVAGPASPATSTVSSATDSLDVGQTTTVELQVFDAYGNPINNTGLSVVFTVSPGTVGTVGAASHVSGNLWSATFTATGSGTAAVGATIDGTPVTTPPALIGIP